MPQRDVSRSLARRWVRSVGQRRMVAGELLLAVIALRGRYVVGVGRTFVERASALLEHAYNSERPAGGYRMAVATRYFVGPASHRRRVEGAGSRTRVAPQAREVQEVAGAREAREAREVREVREGERPADRAEARGAPVEPLVPASGVFRRRIRWRG
jgi:hypothetical protein